MSRYQVIIEEFTLADDFWATAADLPLPEGDHVLLTLAQASRLPILGDHFTARQLYGAADGMRLQSTMLNGRLFTTRSWIQDWINTPWHPARNPLASGSTRQTRSGASSTPGKSVASGSLRARLAGLKRPSKNTS